MLVFGFWVYSVFLQSHLQEQGLDFNKERVLWGNLLSLDILLEASYYLRYILELDLFLFLFLTIFLYLPLPFIYYFIMLFI
jgi:hypothetical protein